MRMSIHPPLIDPKSEMQLGQCEEEDASLEATNSVTQKKLPHLDA